MAAEKHGKDDFGILSYDIGAPHVMVRIVCAQLTDNSILAAAAGVAPQPCAPGGQRNPPLICWRRIGDPGFDDIAGTDKRFEVPVAAGRVSLSIEIADPVGHEREARHNDLFVPPRMVLVQITS